MKRYDPIRFLRDFLCGVLIGGGAIFTATKWLYSSATERMASGPACKAAPFVSAIGLYFACQCLTGFFF